MDAGITIRPVSGVVAADYARPASVPVQQAVATDLDPSQSITAVAGASPIRNDPFASQGSAASQTAQAAQSQRPHQDAVAAQDAVSRQILIDPATRDVVLRVIDTRTHQVVRQIPDQALLRMRAYARALQRGQSTGQAAQRADIAV